jgi:ABC-type sugar transport system ATPase subunit
MIAGVEVPDGGELIVNGRPVHYRAPSEALADGIVLIAQEVTLVPRRSVIENIFLGIENTHAGVISRKGLERRYEQLNERLAFDLDPYRVVGDLPFNKQQEVEILKAIARDSRLLIMDEPTASLGPSESEKLFQTLRSLRSGGTTIVFISHNLEDVLQLSDRISILRDGRRVRTAVASEEDSASLIGSMLGRPLSSVFPSKRQAIKTKRPVLSVQSLSRKGSFENISFDLHAGEILGMAGLVGAGRSEVARAIFGADPYTDGTISIDGRPVRFKSPRDAVRNGIAMIPESRRSQGLLLSRSIEENLALPCLGAYTSGGILRSRFLSKACAEMIQRLDVRATDFKVALGRLSGGNQQKILFGKWLMLKPRVLIADEPTRGVDVGAKQAIYALLDALAADGIAVLLIASELEEIIGLSHRVIVMRGGRVTAELSDGDIHEAAILNAAFEPIVRAERSGTDGHKRR